MGAKFGDLDDYWSPGLTLTVRGKEYTLPLPSAELGLWCRRVAAVAGEVNAAAGTEEIQAAVQAVEALPELPGGRNITLQERVLGDVYQQMVGDAVPDPYIQFCGATAYLWIIAGEDAAQRYWTSGGRPEAPGPANRAERRATGQKTRTAGAAATPSPASTSGTTTRRRSGGSGTRSGSRGRTS